MLQDTSRAWMLIHMDALHHNMKEIRSFLHDNTKIIAVVKANMYGLGDVVVATEFMKMGIDYFAVSSVDEAVHLRENGIKGKMLILGYTPPKHFSLLVKYDLIQTLVSLEYAKKLDIFAKEHDCVITCNAKADTGMGRIGVRCVEGDYHIEELIELYQLPHLKVEGMFSHFSVSDELAEEHKAYTQMQVKQFQQVIHDLKEAGIDAGYVHLQNSYGIINYPELSYDYVRPGIILCGVSSDENIATLHEINLKPVMELKANVSRVKQVPAGMSISYGRHYRSESSRTIATLTIGYADGFSRNLSNQARVLIHGEYANIVGNICMDQCMIDVTHIPNVKEGDVATLIGFDGDKEIKIDEMSHHLHTINNATLCMFTSRLPRIYVK